MPAPSYCYACGTMKPSDLFAPASAICSHCARMDPGLLVSLVRETCAREHAAITATSGARSAARRTARALEHAHKGGKRCSACHGRKPVGDFDRCATRGDGLQPNCRGCNALYRELRKLDGGRQMWETARDAMRAQNDEKPTT